MYILEDKSIKEHLGDSPFEVVRSLDGTTYRNKEGRRTFKTKLGDKNYFIKYHQGIGWREIFKELSQLRLPIISAYNEYRAIKEIKRMGIATTEPIAIAYRGLNPAHKESFLITKSLENTITLKDVTQNWPKARPAFSFKLALIKKVAWIASTMHSHGINHRDFYLCHFRIEESIVENQTSESLHLYLMDLHRAMIRHKVPFRWQVKDLGALMFSAADIGLTRTDYLRFIKYYSGKSLRQELTENQNLWERTYSRAKRFYQREWKRSMPSIF